MGVTGIIGSGKSTFSRFLAELGAAVFDADQAAREVTEEEEVLRRIREHFGSGVFAPDGSLDRAALAGRVFQDPGELAWLNRLIHPRVREKMWAFVESARRDPAVPVIVIDAPLVFETDLHRYLDAVIVVAADPETCIQRTMKRSGIDRSRIVERMKNQMPLDEKIRRADFVVDNNGDLAHLKEQAAKIFRQILERFQSTS